MSLPAGLCDSCLHMRVIRSDRGSTFYQCQLSFEDTNFPKYPRLPVLKCSGWAARNSDVRRASPTDIALLVDLMAEFYAEAGYLLDRARAKTAFSDILADERLGYVWIIQAGDQDVGHLVLTLRYGMEFGGLIACLDDLYVKPEWRNRGLSKEALLKVRDFCEKTGVRALTVEVGHNNGPAQRVYRKVGFEEATDRQLLALALAPPTHIV